MRSTRGSATRSAPASPHNGSTQLFDIRDRQFPQDAIDEAASILHWVDATFSVFRHDSEISRIGRGELSVADAHLRVRTVLATCEILRRDTAGAFDHRSETRLDPSGYVKGWAVEQAARILTGSGIDSYLISAGGDIVAHGTPTDGELWKVGIRDPLNADATIGTVNLHNNAIATSGLYERGAHIRGTERSGDALASVSIIGPDLGVADALATAVFASGLDHIHWLNDFPEYDLVAVTSDGRILGSPTAAYASADRST
jgi:thiamine biosynthesis lipoprotein